MSSETEAFLASVRGAEDPTRADEERVLRAVQATIAAGALLGAVAASPKLARLTAWSAGSGFKGGAAVLGLLAIGGIAALHSGGTALQGAKPVAAPHQPHTQGIARPAATSVSAKRIGASHQPRSTGIARPATTLRPAEPVQAPAAPSAPLSSKRAARSAGTVFRTPASSSASVRPPPESGPGSGLREELSVLARAQAALRRRDGAAALSILDGASPGQPQLGAERATLRVLALCALGRIVEARRVAVMLERMEPGSLQRDVLSRSCAGSAASPR